MIPNPPDPFVLSSSGTAGESQIRVFPAVDMFPRGGIRIQITTEPYSEVTGKKLKPRTVTESIGPEHATMLARYIDAVVAATKDGDR